MPSVPEIRPTEPVDVSGAPTDEDLDEAERLCRSHAPAAEVGAYGRLIQAIARTLADERRKAFNVGAVAGMKLSKETSEADGSA